MITLTVSPLFRLWALARRSAEPFGLPDPSVWALAVSATMIPATRLTTREKQVSQAIDRKCVLFLISVDPFVEKAVSVFRTVDLCSVAHHDSLYRFSASELGRTGISAKMTLGEAAQAKCQG